MLHSRLSLSDTTTLINAEEVEAALRSAPQPIDQAAALALGARLKADYVLMGNLTVLGDNVSTDAILLDVHQQAPALKFSKFGESRGDALAHVNLFATQINENIFGYRARSPRPTQYAGGATGGGYAAHSYPSESAARIWKTRKFKTEIVGLAVGDVDGDGNNETVFVSDNKIFVYRFQENAFRKISELPGKEYERIIGIDIADANKNGKAELFITNIKDKGNHLRSYVLEWDETSFKEIAENQKWFFRVVNAPQRGKILLGQKIGVPPKLLQGDIFELKWEGGDYVADLRQELPKDIRICGFTYGDVLNDGVQRVVAFNENERLMLLNPDGKEEWISSDRYGGSASYLEYPTELREKGRRDLTDHFYLPQRVHVADIDQDGNNEVLVVTNHDVTKGVFQRFRSFDSGYIECLFWNTLGLQPKWRTQKVSGYISDYVVADLNNDGRDELAFAVVSKGRNLIGPKKSFIVSYDKNTP